MIRKIILLVILAFTFSCSKTQDNYTINGTIDSSLDTKKVEIFRYDARKKVVLDTTTIQNGAFKFSGKAAESDAYFLAVEGIKEKLPFVLENVDMKFTIYKDSLFKSVVTGSKENDIVRSYQNDLKNLTDFNKQIQKRYKLAQVNKDVKATEAAKASYHVLQKKH